jgi:Kef-type K+ transport system membrane component KefB
MPGIPVGPGTVFYLAAALVMPLVTICRRLAGRQNLQSRRQLSRQVGVAVGMLLTGAFSFWLFDRVASAVDRHRQTGVFLLTSPLLVALLVLGAMVAVRPVIRRVGQSGNRADRVRP